MQHYEFRVQTAKMKWVILGCNAGATWVQSGFKEGATREQSKCKVSEKPGAKWVQSGVQSGVQSRCNAGAKRVHAITILQVLFKGAKTGAKEF